MARGIIVCGLLAVFNVLAAEEQQPLKELESALSDVKTVRTRFVQEKKMALFKKPMITKGAILLEIPGKLMWKVESPVKYALLIDGQYAKQWDGQTGKTVSIALADQPVFAAVTQQLRAWFAGNYRVLSKDYTIKKLDAEQLTFDFIPKPDVPQAKMLKRITVTFQKDKKYISLFQIEENGGDLTKMVFEETAINAVIDKKEWNLP
ncbi:MAG: outer membrane lipoprotein carrier protein LolA [bacterium]